MPNSSGEYHQFGYKLTDRTYSNAPPEHSSLLVDPSFRVVWSRESVNTPGYGKLVRARKRTGIDLPMNPFGFSKETAKASGTMYTFIDTPSEGTWSDELVSGPRPRNNSGPSESSSVISALQSKAASKVLTKLLDQSINLGVAVGEGRQTVNLLFNTAKRLASSFRQLKRGDGIGAARILTGQEPPSRIIKWGKRLPADLRKDTTKAISNGWLELQYGWMPLLSDLFGACEFLANKLNRPPRMKVSTRTFRGFEERDSSKNSSGNITTTHEMITYYEVRYVLYFSQQEDHDLAALGLRNPLSVAWELVPYSFIVDWILPIGTFLNNLDATYGLQFIKGSKTYFYRGSRSYTDTGGTGIDANHFLTSTGWVQDRVDKVRCVREVLTSWPSNPTPSFKNPFSQFNSVFDPGAHVASSLALLTQAFKR